MINLNNYSYFLKYLINYDFSFSNVLNLVFVFLLWLTFWSFLTMLVYRLFFYEEAIYDEKTQEAKNIMNTILYWRSYCPVCKTTLEPKYLVPLFSYIFLRWKCWYCWGKIPISYFLIEIGLWLIFSFLYLYLSYIGLITQNIDMWLLYSIILFLSVVILYWLLLYDIRYLYLSYILNNIWYILSGILLLISFMISYKLWLFLILFVVLNYLFFYLINWLAKLYYGIKIWFKNIKDLELIGTGDFFALVNILLFTWFITWYKYIKYIWQLDYSNINSYLHILWIVIVFFTFYIIIASIVTLIYYIISFLIWYKNEEQIKTEQELEDNHIHSPVIPFLPWLILSWIIMILFI